MFYCSLNALPPPQKKTRQTNKATNPDRMGKREWATFCATNVENRSNTTSASFHRDLTPSTRSFRIDAVRQLSLSVPQKNVFWIGNYCPSDWNRSCVGFILTARQNLVMRFIRLPAGSQERVVSEAARAADEATTMKETWKETFRWQAASCTLITMLLLV